MLDFITRLDPFEFFQISLGVFVVTYYTLMTIASVGKLVALMRGQAVERRLLREIIAYQAASVRVSPLAGELFQIVALFAMLILLWLLRPGWGIIGS